MKVSENDLMSFRSDWGLADQAQSTVDEYLRQLRKYASWCKQRKLQTSSMRSGKDYLAETKERSNSMAYLVSRALKSYSKWYANEYDEPDVFKELPFVKQQQSVQRTATVADVAKMLLVIENDLKGLRDRAIVTVLANSGMRRSECANLRWADIDMDIGTALLPKTKSGKPRVIGIGRDSLRAIRRYVHALEPWELDHDREPCEFVWISTTRHGPLSSNGIAEMIEQRARQAHANVTAHSFRRSFSIKWLNEGGNETGLMRHNGWSSPRMVAVYTAALAQDETLRQHKAIFG